MKLGEYTPPIRTLIGLAPISIYDGEKQIYEGSPGGLKKHVGDEAFERLKNLEIKETNEYFGTHVIRLVPGESQAEAPGS